MKSAVLEDHEQESSPFRINLEKIDRRYRINSWDLSRPEVKGKAHLDNRTRKEDYFRYFRPIDL